MRQIGWMTPCRTPVLRHHADLLRERRAPHRARVHDGGGRRAGPVAAALGRRRGVPHRHRRARAQDPAGGRGPRRHPARVGRHATARCSAPRGTTSTSPTTTTSAPPSPATSGRCRSSSSGSTTPATSSSTATRASTAWAASSTTRRTSSTTACAARSTAPSVEHVTEENYFFRLSRYEDRLLAHYTEHPEAVQPAGKRNEVLGLIKQGLLDFSISRTSISWGIPLPWDHAPRRVRLVRRADQLLHRGRLSRRRANASTATGPRTTTSSARTSSASTRCTGPRC